MILFIHVHINYVESKVNIVRHDEIHNRENREEIKGVKFTPISK